MNNGESEYARANLFVEVFSSILSDLFKSGMELDVDNQLRFGASILKFLRHHLKMESTLRFRITNDAWDLTFVNE